MSELFAWAATTRAQPEPIAGEIWKKLPEEFRRQVEIVDGHAVWCEPPSRLHQKTGRKLTGMIGQAAVRHAARNWERLYADVDVDVILWGRSRAQIRRPDVALFRCVPEDLKPLPAHLVLLAVEVLSGAGRVETVDKRAEYAAAGIPWYWIVRLGDDGVDSIDVLALDHAMHGYRRVTTYERGTAIRAEDGPIRISLDWSQL